MLHLCRICGIEFESPVLHQIYCGHSCRDKAKHSRSGPRKRSRAQKNAKTVFNMAKADRRVQITRDIKEAIGCAMCGEKDPRCLQFAHRDPTQKFFSIAHGIKMGLRFLWVLMEMMKCDVLCANCHIKHHADNPVSTHIRRGFKARNKASDFNGILPAIALEPEDNDPSVLEAAEESEIAKLSHRLCVYCGEDFKPISRVQIVCSKPCGKNFYSNGGKKKDWFKTERQCKKCDAIYIPNKPKQKFCSTACAAKYTASIRHYPLPATPGICEHCRTSFKQRLKIQRFCSNRCKRRAIYRRKKAVLKIAA